jgi:NAD-dependent deacetylase
MNAIAIPDDLTKLLRGRVLVVTGSGVSAESGIPTFRGAGGLWRNFDATKLATPEAFDNDPDLVWEWYSERRRAILHAKPNAGHEALARLSAIAADHLVLTQNVDDLHERAGTPADRLVHIHGEIFVSRCTSTRCGFETRDPSIAAPPLPRCPTCHALLRPGVVWFGEGLNPREIARVERFLDRPIDLAIVIGTTAIFGYIVDWSTRGAHLVEINPEPTPLSDRADWTYRHRAGDVLSKLLAS